jgi:hypothetical protein
MISNIGDVISGSRVGGIKLTWLTLIFRKGILTGGCMGEETNYGKRTRSKRTCRLFS